MGAVAAALSPNLFVSPPLVPKINSSPNPKRLSPPIPIPKYPPRRNKQHPTTSFPHKKHITHIATDVVSPKFPGESVLLGESGVSYIFPGAPFEFKFSYSETPLVKPIAIRKPTHLPFAPHPPSRPWTGKTRPKISKKKIRLTESAVALPEGSEGTKEFRVQGSLPHGRYVEPGRTREDILGEPLTMQEIKEFVQPLLSSNRQVNLGRDGVTHNMLEMIHHHWKRQRVCKIRCRGVPTIDMRNVCHVLEVVIFVKYEEKTGGKVIHQAGGIIFLFRGRNYDYRTHPQYPRMLWRPTVPVYPKLIDDAPDGLTPAEANELKKKGQELPPICKLAKNGIYNSLVKDIREAFEETPLVKINCESLEASDLKRIGAKLKDLVPCLLLSFDHEQILIWRGKSWNSVYSDKSVSCTPNRSDSCAVTSAAEDLSLSVVPKADSGQSGALDVQLAAMSLISLQNITSLWKLAVETNKAKFIGEINLTPDDLMEKVLEFEALLCGTGHSYQTSSIHCLDGNALQENFKDDEYKAEADDALCHGHDVHG